MSEQTEKIVPVFIEEEMRSSYIDYSMSVIVSRALPDVRDGLKPVHRRVLFGMLDLGLRPASAYKKSARIVGEVLGKYHPHGDAAVYDAMVRMVQEFSLRYPLVDGQGNFGSVDGDAPAAMRYTEARLAGIAEEVIRDIDKETVDFVANFDDTLKEPSVLPSLLPTILVNGAAGIAVGMATNMPPHNLGEVVDALIAVIDKPEIKPEQIKKYLKGPDFPTGAIISGSEEIDAYFKTGRGKLMVRARAHVEDVSAGRQRIVVTEIPYQVNKASLIERVAELVRDKKIEGISDIRDESDREGMRIVFELRKEAETEGILQDLFKHTQMQTTFGVIMLALIKGQPKVLNIKQILDEFLAFRHEIVLRRTRFELDKAEKRAHILEGLKIALDNIDAIIALIKKSRDVDAARNGLIKQFKLSEIQAQAILDMRLQRLTGLERKKIEDEYRELIKLIEKLRSLLKSKSLRMQLVKEELKQLKEKYGDPRRTLILDKSSGQKLEDLLSEDAFIIAVTADQQIAKIPVLEWQTRKDDYALARFVFPSSNSQFMVFTSSLGKAYLLRTSFIPSATDNSAALLAKVLPMQKDEEIIGCCESAKVNEKHFLLMASRDGLVKKISLNEFTKIKENGAQIISLKPADPLVGVAITDGKQDILLATKSGKCIRFNEQDVRDMGLAAGGIRGIALEQQDQVISLVIPCKEDDFILSFTELGFAKRSRLAEYSCIKRGGKGIVNYKINDKVGVLSTVLAVAENDQIGTKSKKGKIKKLRAKEIKIMGRATSGVAFVNLKKGDELISAFLIRHNH